MIAPEIFLDVDSLGGVNMVYTVVNRDGGLEEHKAVVLGIDGWKRFRAIADSPNTIRWRAVR